MLADGAPGNDQRKSHTEEPDRKNENSKRYNSVEPCSILFDFIENRPEETPKPPGRPPGDVRVGYLSPGLSFPGTVQWGRIANSLMPIPHRFILFMRFRLLAKTVHIFLDKKKNSHHPVRRAQKISFPS